MTCRVGMSTDPYTRINYWMALEGHTSYQILATNLTYEEALERERIEALSVGCKQSAGGPHMGGRVWSVYRVSGGR